MARKFKVGGNCDCWCTRCRMVLEHVIIAMVESQPKRVQCTTCQSQHNYKLAPGRKVRRTTAGSQKTRSRTKTPRTRKSNWGAMVSGRDVSMARLYKVSATFEANELIDHSQFGVGVVLEAMPGNKIEVLFEQGAKLLVHSR